MHTSYAHTDQGVVPTLSGRKFAPEELSAGQRMLLYHITCLLNSLMRDTDLPEKKTLLGAIVLLDEPDLHLHPRATIQLIDSLRRVVGDTGQVWIASHSASLLPFLGPNEIRVVEDGVVSPPGIEQFEKAMCLLVGSEEDLDRMRDSFQEPDRWAANKFVAECLLAPGQAAFKEGDPQLLQISALTNERLTTGRELRVLDCGAGRGRLASLLASMVTPDQQRHVQYIPVEPDSARDDEIKAAAGAMLAECGVSRNVESVPATYDGTVDVAVLCNTLHEIRPTKWKCQLESLLRLLGPEGALVICEDEAIPHGELPHELGYLVLGPGEIAQLFQLKKPPRMRAHPEEKYAKRLMCVEVPGRTAAVSGKSVRNAIEGLERRLTGLIEQMRQREKAPTAKEGRLYAFYSQMLVNCRFALRELA